MLDLDLDFFNNVSLGITSKCNAKCYLCNRTTLKDFPMEEDMPFETFKKIVPFTKYIEFSGSFGDFINHPESLKFAEYTKNQNTKFAIETNAGIKSEKYWKDLAKIANDKDHLVRFSIDDISNEENVYRKVNTKTVLKNLKCFIDAGGYADVKTLMFKFNDGQIQEKFIPFFRKIGVNHLLTQYSMVYQPKGPLSAPDEYVDKKGTLSLLYKINNKLTEPLKKCPWSKGKWVYILENGEVHTCCNLFVFGVNYQDRFPDELVVYTDTDQYDGLDELYLNNKDLINLNNDNVTMSSAYNNKYNVYTRTNFSKITRCHKRCKVYDIIDKSITGTTLITL